MTKKTGNKGLSLKNCSKTQLTKGQRHYRKYKETFQKYRAEHKAGAKKYRDEHKHIMAIYRDDYHFGGNRLKVLERDGYRCRRCFMSMAQHIEKWGCELTVDHLDGKGRNSKVKNHDINNLITFCLQCHGKKDIVRRKFHPIAKASLILVKLKSEIVFYTI